MQHERDGMTGIGHPEVPAILDLPISDMLPSLCKISHESSIVPREHLIPGRRGDARSLVGEWSNFTFDWKRSLRRWCRWQYGEGT
jgi:hypothetical protein